MLWSAGRLMRTDVSLVKASSGMGRAETGPMKQLLIALRHDVFVARVSLGRAVVTDGSFNADGPSRVSFQSAKALDFPT